jgi:hypothetical protein
MSFSSFFTQVPLFVLPTHQYHHLLPPLSSPCPVPSPAGQLAGAPWRSWACSAMWVCQHPWNLPRAHKISRYPLRKPPRGSILLPRVLLAPRRALADASEAAAPPILPLVSSSPTAWAHATIPSLVPIKAPLEALELVAPKTPTSTSHHPCVDASLCPHIVQTNLPTTSSTSPQSCTAASRALILIGAPPPPPAPAASSVPPSASCLGPPLPHPRPQTGVVCFPLAFPTSESEQRKDQLNLTEVAEDLNQRSKELPTSFAQESKPRCMIPVFN